METHLVMESIKFMILGMTVVFIFLSALVWLMGLQARILQRFFPEKEPPSIPNRSMAQREEERRRTAAIIAAIEEFRKT